MDSVKRCRGKKKDNRASAGLYGASCKRSQRRCKRAEEDALRQIVACCGQEKGRERSDYIAHLQHLCAMAGKWKRDKHLDQYGRGRPHWRGHEICKPAPDRRCGQGIRTGQEDGGDIDQSISKVDISSVRSIGYVENICGHQGDHCCE